MLQQQVSWPWNYWHLGLSESLLRCYPVGDGALSCPGTRGVRNKPLVWQAKTSHGRQNRPKGELDQGTNLPRDVCSLSASHAVRVGAVWQSMHASTMLPTARGLELPQLRRASGQGVPPRPGQPSSHPQALGWEIGSRLWQVRVCWK